MIEDCGGIFGLVSLWPWIEGRLFHSPNIVGDFGYGWAICYHGRKLRKACARMLLNYIIKCADENLCDWFHLDRDQIKLTRPFLPQRMESYDCQ